MMKKVKMTKRGTQIQPCINYWITETTAIQSIHLAIKHIAAEIAVQSRVKHVSSQISMVWRPNGSLANKSKPNKTRGDWILG